MRPVTGAHIDLYMRMGTCHVCMPIAPNTCQCHTTSYISCRQATRSRCLLCECCEWWPRHSFCACGYGCTHCQTRPSTCAVGIGLVCY